MNVKGVTLGDLYEEVLRAEEAINRMALDIENAECDSATKCILENELGRILEMYEDLLNSNFEFSKLNFASIVHAVNECLECIEIGDGIEYFQPTYMSESTCKSNSVALDITDIKRIRVYEVSKSSTPDVYLIGRNQLPYVFQTVEGEEYVVSWDSFRTGVSIKVFNQKPGGNVRGFFNIAKVVAELTEGAVNKYKVEEVHACKVDIITSGAAFDDLKKAIDGNEKTYPTMTRNNTVVEGVFQFRV